MDFIFDKTIFLKRSFNHIRSQVMNLSCLKHPLRWNVCFLLTALTSLFGEADIPALKEGEETPLHLWSQEPFEGAKHLKKFDPHMLHLVDHNQNNFLFRGNLPLKKKGSVKHEFAYEELVDAIKECLAEQNIPVKTFTIMDISFLNYFTDFFRIEKEKHWFRHHPETGCFLLKPFYGIWLDPCSLSEESRLSLLLDDHLEGLFHDFYELKTFIPYLKHIMDTPSHTDFVIYMHCIEGKDRTGAAAACYLMHHHGHSYKQVIEQAQGIADRTCKCLMFPSKYAIQWYAFYLRDVLGIGTIGCIE